MSLFLPLAVDTSSSAYKFGEMIGGGLAIGLFIAIPVLFVLSLVKTIQKKGALWVVILVITSLIGLAMVIGTIVMASKGFKAAAEAVKDRDEIQVVEDPEGLISVGLPGHWKEIPGLNDEAEMTYGNMVAEQYFIVLREPKVDFDEMDLEGYGEIIFDQMEVALERSEAGEWTPLEGSLLNMKSRVLTGSTEGIRISYLVGVMETESDFYQVLQWSLPSRWDDTLPVFEQVLGSVKEVE
ncbi:MAG: hypothetical protein ACSHYF_18040 [Verrucomicrobiaceae bacterium]